MKKFIYSLGLDTPQLIFMIILILMIGGIVIGIGEYSKTTNNPDRPYQRIYYEGKVIATTDNGKIYLDNGTVLYLPQKFELIKGATYKFFFKKWDDWVSHSEEFQSMELIK